MQCHLHYLTKYKAIPGTKTGKLAASGMLYFQVQHGLLYCSVSQSLRPQQGSNKIHLKKTKQSQFYSFNFIKITDQEKRALPYFTDYISEIYV